MEQVADREAAAGHSASSGRSWRSRRSAAGNTALFIFPLCVLFVFLTHSGANTRASRCPPAIILIVPMCLLCGIAGVWLRGMDNNIFTQIGFVVLAGLAARTPC